jgi:hypothetical protein
MRELARLASIVLCAVPPTAIIPEDGQPSPLPHKDELAVQEALVRHAVKWAGPPCVNQRSKDAYCLVLGEDQRDPGEPVLRRLRDVRPPVRTVSECRRKGIVGHELFATDPAIRIHWIRPRPDGAVEARVTIYCGTSHVTLRRGTGGWTLETGGWIGCGILPPDCIFSPPRAQPD